MKFVSPFIILLSLLSACTTHSELRVLIVQGQNNHGIWPKSTIMMKQYLEETGLFKVDIETSKYVWKAEMNIEFLDTTGLVISDKPKTDPNFSPDFEKYDVIISNFGWNAAPWPKATQEAFEQYMKNGGGFVVTHAANNSFPEWKAFNKMIGLAGWGGRSAKDGPYVYYQNDKMVRDSSAGKCGAHGAIHHFPITLRDTTHPITKGLPLEWLSAKDECYAKLRGPAENMTILATGKDQSQQAPTDRDEPILMVINYKKGRVFHSTLGHDDISIESVDFMVTFTRGVEWAATGKVTQDIPCDFPKKGKSSIRKFMLK